jgi:hypothetical protein
MPPAGYVKNEDEQLEKDPDRRVREAVLLVFRKFLEFGSARQTLLWFLEQGLQVPVAAPRGKREFEKGVVVRERPAAKNAARQIINNLRLCDPPSLPHEVVENTVTETFQTASEAHRSAEGGARSGSLYGGRRYYLFTHQIQGDSGQHGREEQYVTSGELTKSPDGFRGQQPDKRRREVGSNALSEVGPLPSTASGGKPPRPRQGRPEWAGEGGGGRTSVKSKDVR